MTTTCKYCGEDVPEAERLAHFKRSHYGELTGPDRCRVDEAFGTPSARSRLPSVVGAVGVAVLGAPFLSLFTGYVPIGVAEGEPYGLDTQHIHGNMIVSYDGAVVDFAADQYQLRDSYFHFEGKEGNRWQVHGSGVTLAYGLSTVGFDVTADSVAFGGRTFVDGEAGASVTVTVDGQPVDPATYVLQDGDDVRVVVTTPGAA